MFLFSLLIILIISSFSIFSKSQKIEENLKTDVNEKISSFIDSNTDFDLLNSTSIILSLKNDLNELKQSLWFINNQNFSGKTDSILKTVQDLIKASDALILATVKLNDALLLSYNFADQPLEETFVKMQESLEFYNEAQNLLLTVNTKSLPASVQEKIKQIQASLQNLDLQLLDLEKQFPALLKMLGDKLPHRYLILLQNNSEIRPTGGFIGSFLILDLNDGKVENLKFSDVYDLDDSYGGFIAPPEELAFFINNFRLRDANVSYDFTYSAQKILQLLELEGGPSVDTVIALNQSSLSEYLKILGPIDVADVGIFNNQNYLVLLSYFIESKFFGANNPKDILNQFIDAFVAKIKPELLPQIIATTYKEMTQKNILAYSKDPEIQTLFQDYGLSGEAKKLGPKDDYLAVIHYSVGGNKSDQFIEEKITHKTNITANGDVDIDLNIKRTHLWNDQILFKWRQELERFGLKLEDQDLIYIFGRGANRSLTRIYVPKNSQLISSSNEDLVLKYDEQLDRDYFLVNLEVPLWKATELDLKYRLPFRYFLDEEIEYSFYADKQPGSRTSLLTKSISVPESFDLMLTFPAIENYRQTDLSEYEIATDLLYDQFLFTTFAQTSLLAR